MSGNQGLKARTPRSLQRLLRELRVRVWISKNDEQVSYAQFNGIFFTYE